MPNEKYLYFFRFQYPIDWINKNDHEVFEFVFINAESEERTLEWGNYIAEKFIEELFISKNYPFRKIGFAGGIWANPDYKFGEQEREEAEDFPIVNYGEYPSWNFEVQ